ncbi:MAG: cation:dicarboxylase symporter family transporter [Alphaproteobacteria bacterium]|nr:cation:dicarboxylase symporter family transporter [Alphaproteobacteria bacterium]
MPQGFSLQNATFIGLFGTILLTALLVPYMPVHYLKIMYTLSILIKDVIMWALPVFICFNIAFMLDSMKKQAILMIVSIIVFEFISNACSMLFGYFYAMMFKIPVSKTLSAECDACLDPYFSLSQTIPKLWSCQNGVLFGIALGLLMAYVPKLRLNVSLEFLKQKVDFFFSKIIGRLVPIFIIGFVANSYHMGIFQNTMIYGKAIVLAFIGVMIYCFLIFFVGMGGLSKAIKALKNVMPAYVMAFTTASSFATMPTTIACTIKNAKNPLFPQAIIPATTNIQQIGDCLFNAYLIFVVMDTFGMPAIGFMDWLYFVFWYVLARYAMPAMLGAAMFVLFPLYVSILGFTHEMLAVVLAINVLIDPLITCCNVLANSGLCIVFENFLEFIQKKYRLHS